MRNRFLFVLVLLPCLLSPVQAGIFGRKKDKQDPKSRVAQLLTTLKNDRDAASRARAAEDLRHFDPGQYQEILPALMHALHNDPSPSVRVESAQTLGKMRPVAQEVGQALEQAVANDTSMRVRLQARSALLHYHWAGYRSGKKTDVPPLNTSREPPMAVGSMIPPAIRTSPTPAPTTTPVIRPTAHPSYRPVSAALTAPVPSTQEPPLAPPLPNAAPLPAPGSMPPPLPTVPANTVPQDSEGPVLE